MRKGIHSEFVLESCGFKGKSYLDKTLAEKEQIRIDYELQKKEMTREIDRNKVLADVLKKESNDLKVLLEK